MMKVLLLLGLLALAEARWVPDYRPLESISERELIEEASHMQDTDSIKYQFNLQPLDEVSELDAENYRDVSLEDQEEAIQASDATLERQGDLGGDGEERRDVVAGGQLVSSHLDNPEESRFMDVPADSPLMDQSLYRY